MKRKVLFVLLVVAVVSSLAFIGCAAPAPAPAPIAPAPGPEPTPIPGPQFSGILKIITNEGPHVLGAPCLDEAGMAWEFAGECVFEPLVRLDKKGSPTPFLATGWEEDPEGKFITMHLREGVKFHDGTDFNAEAVKWNIDTRLEYVPWDLPHVESIDVIDEYTVRFNTSHYSNTFWATVAYVVGMIASPEAAAKEVPEEEVPYAHMVGTGAFKFVDWERDAFMKFERFDDYWQEGKPYLEGIEFTIIADPVTRSIAFMAGEAPIVLNLQPKAGHDLKEAGYETKGIAGWLTIMLPDGVNPDSPFGDKRVRAAVEYAIDRQAIADAFGYGYVEALNQACDPATLGYIPDFEGRPYNPNKAKQLLAEADYPDGFETRIIASGMDDLNVLVAIQNYLSEVGIDATLDIQEMGLLEESQFVTGWYNGLFAGWVGGEANHAFSIGREFSPVPGEKHMEMNVSVFVPDGWEELLWQATIAKDIETQEALTQELVRMLHDEAMIIPLWPNIFVYASDGSVQDTGLYETTWISWTPENAWISQ